MKPSDYKIIDLIPQRPPMIMIDRLVNAAGRSAEGSLLITESNIFCRDGAFQEAGIVEFIAQTAAAHTGYLMLEAGREISLGFIGSVKNLNISSLPPAGKEIRSEIVIDSELLGYTIITGKVFLNGIMLADCEIRIKLGSS